MNEVDSFLTEWTIDYVKNKDIIARKIESIEKETGGFDIVVRYKDRVCCFIVRHLIHDIEEIIKKIDKEGHYGLVMLNNKKNFDIILNNWKRLIDFKNLCIYFVNPFSELDKSWLLRPHIHNRICDEDSLVSGLKSMFSMVEQTTEEDAKRRLKQESN